MPRRSYRVAFALGVVGGAVLGAAATAVAMLFVPPPAVLVAIIVAMSAWTTIRLSRQAAESRQESGNLAERYLTPAIREAERAEAAVHADHRR